MQIAMLEPLEVRDDDGAAVPVAGIRLRRLLIALALTPRQLIPTTRLIDAIWGDEPRPGRGMRSKRWCRGCAGRFPRVRSSHIRRAIDS